MRQLRESPVSREHQWLLKGEVGWYGQTQVLHVLERLHGGPVVPRSVADDLEQHEALLDSLELDPPAAP
jgi:hypothetical protein